MYCVCWYDLDPIQGHGHAVMTISMGHFYVYYTLSQKNVPPLVRYNFDIREHILIFFGINVTHKVCNQKHFTMPAQIVCASALPGKTGKLENRIFHLNAVSVHSQNSTSRSLILSVFLTRLILKLLCDSLNLVVSAFSSGFWGHGLRERAEAVGLCCTHSACAPMRCLLKEKMSSVMCLIASDICWDSKISH